MPEVLIPNGGETQKTNVRVVISLNTALAIGDGLQIFRNTFAIGLANIQDDLTYFLVDNVYLGGNFKYTAKVQKADGSLVDSNDYIIRLGGAAVIDLNSDNNGSSYFSRTFALIPGKKYKQKTFQRSLFPASDDISLQYPIIKEFTASGSFVEYTSSFPRGNPSYTSNDSSVYIELWDEDEIILEGISNPVRILGVVPSNIPVYIQSLFSASTANALDPNAKLCVRSNIPIGGTIRMTAEFARLTTGIEYKTFFRMRKKGENTLFMDIPLTPSNGSVSNLGISFEYDTLLSMDPGVYICKMGINTPSDVLVIETPEIQVVFVDNGLFTLPSSTYAIDVYSGNASQTLIAGGNYDFYYALTGMEQNRDYSLRVNRISLSGSTNVFQDFTATVTTDGLGALSGVIPDVIAGNAFADVTSVWCEVRDITTNKIVLNSDPVIQDLTGAAQPARIIYPSNKLTWSITSGTISPDTIVSLEVNVTGLSANKTFTFNGNFIKSDLSILVSFTDKYISTDSSGNGTVSFDVTIPANASIGNVSISIVGVSGGMYQITGTPIQSTIIPPTPTAYWNVNSGQLTSVRRGDSFFGDGYVSNLNSNTSYNLKYYINSGGANVLMFDTNRETIGTNLGLYNGIVVPADAAYIDTNYFVEIRDTGNILIITTGNVVFTVVEQLAASVLTLALANGQATTVNEGDAVQLVGTYTNLIPNDYCYVQYNKRLNGGSPYQLGFQNVNVDSNGLLSFNLNTTMSTAGFFGGFQPGDIIEHFVKIFDNSYGVLEESSNIVNVTVGNLIVIPTISYVNTGSSNISYGDNIVGTGTVNLLTPNTEYDIYISAYDSQYFTFTILDTSYTADNSGEIVFNVSVPFPAGVNAGTFNLDVYLRAQNSSDTLAQATTIQYNVIVVIPNVLLLNITGQGSNGSTDIVDTSDVVKTITKAPATAISTAKYPVGSTSSISFNGSSDYVKASIGVMPYDEPYSFEADIYLNSISSTGFGTYGDFSGSVRGVSFIINSNGTFSVLFGKAGDIARVVSGSGTLVANTWYHVAFRSTGTGTDGFTLYIDYTLNATGTSPGIFLTNTSFVVGRTFSNTSSSYTNGAAANIKIRTGPSEATRDFTIVPTPPVVPAAITATLSASQTQPVLAGNTISFDVVITNLTASTTYNINYQHVYAPSGVYIVSTDSLSTNTSGNITYTKSITLADGWNTNLALADGQVIDFNVMVATIGGTTVLTSSNVAVTVSVPASNPYPTYVAAAMRFEDINNSTNFVDETNQHTVTYTGDAHISTASPIFETGSLVLGAGSVDIAHSSLLDMTATNFTLEATILLASYPANGVYIFDKDGQASASYPQYELTLNPDGKLNAFLGNGSGVSPSGIGYASTNSIPLNTKTHIALVKSGSLCYGFIGGVLEWSGATPTMYDGGKPLRIGYQTDQAASTYLSAKIDGFRLSRTDLYTASFIPPEDNFIVPVDNTAIVINFTGNSFTETSTNAVTFTTLGAATATVSTEHAYLGTKSIQFVGNGGLVANNANYAFGNLPYAIEADIFFDSVNSGGFGSLTDYTESYDGVSFWLTGSGAYRIRIGKSVGGGFDDIFGSTTLEINKWYRVAIVKRNNGTNGVQVRLNGVVDGTGTSARAITATAFSLGTAYPNMSDGYLTGNISNLTVTTGRGVLTKNYSYTGIDPRTPLSLTRFIGDNGDTVFTDEIGSSWTNIGSPTISTAQSIYGGSSLFLNSGYHITKTFTHAFGTDDFTVEGYFYPTSFSGAKAILNQTSGGISLSLNASGYLSCAIAHIAVLANSSQNPVSLNQWNLITFSRISNVSTVTVGGLIAMSFIDNTNYTPQTIYLGGYSGIPVGDVFEGYIGPFRAVKGIGYYAGAFSPINTTYPPYGEPLTEVLKITGDGINGDSNIVDSSTYENVITVSNSTFSNLTPLPGTTTAIQLTGSSTLSVATTPLFGFGTGDFTIELHINIQVDSNSSGQDFFNFRDGGGAQPFTIYLKNNGGGNFLGAYTSTGSGSMECGNNFIPLNTWSKIVIQRAYGRWYFIIDGQVLTFTVGSISGANGDMGSSKPVVIGTGLQCLVRDIIVNKGIALYRAS